MKKLLLIGLLILISLPESLSAATVSNRIDMGISPIRDEFTVTPGGSTKRTIKFYNNGTSSMLVYVTFEDCVQGEGYGTPKCRAYAGTGGVDPDNASTWIKVDGADRFTIPAKSEKTLTYTVNTPASATPGGHYGAIFFNNPGQSSGGNSVDMVRRIGMLYLIQVPGNIIVNTELGDIAIDIPPLNSAPNIWDRLQENFGDSTAWRDMFAELNPLWEEPELSRTNLQISLSIPVQNSGNIHIKPTGKIYLYDGEMMLTKVGKESIVDENGVFKGEKIVDYLPINDEGGNVLPNSERIFRIDWMGFASQELGPDGTSVISFESPSDYFGRISGDNAQFIYPWEKLTLRSSVKQLKAKVEFSFKNPKDGKEEISTLELPLTISYNYIAKTPNWGAIIIVLLVLLLAWSIIRRRNQEIEELEHETDELDDEIAALERAQKALLAKNTPTKSKSVAKKTPVADTKQKTPTVSPAKKTESIKKPATSKKPATPKVTTSAPAPKKAPAKKSTSSPKSSIKKPAPKSAE